MMQFKKPEKVCKVSSFATDDGPTGTGIKLSPCVKCGFCPRRARIKELAAKNRSPIPPHPILARIASKCDEAKAEIDLMPEPKKPCPECGRECVQRDAYSLDFYCPDCNLSFFDTKHLQKTEIIEIEVNDETR